MDKAFSIEIFLEEPREVSLKTRAAFVDIEKEIDSVIRYRLWAIME